MGKKYFCEYCEKSMVAKYESRKKHLDSVNHKMLVRLHYAQYRDYKTLIDEESSKKLCLRSLKNQCPFGERCFNTHYTKEQLEAIKYEGENLEQQAIEKSKASILNANLTHWFRSVLSDVPECFQNHLASNHQDKTNIPPSLQPTTVENVKDMELTDWG